MLANNDTSIFFEVHPFEHVLVGMVVLLTGLVERPLFAIEFGINEAIVPVDRETVFRAVLVGGELPGDL